MRSWNRRGKSQATDTPPESRPREEWLREARDAAVRRLGVREYSVAELRAYLKRRKIPEDVATEVVDGLAERGYVSDARYAKVLVRDQALKGKGPQAVRQKLSQKGIREDLKAVATMLEEASGQSLLEQALAILERRYPRSHQDEREAQRAYGALVRRGFSFEIAREALKLARRGVALKDTDTET